MEGSGPPEIAHAMKVGFAITRHCNLRCPHCIRDDVTEVRNLPLDLIRSVTDQAISLFGRITVGLTGGEPLLHPELEAIVDHLGHRGLPYRVVTNGWHMARELTTLERHRPEFVRLSLSGATAESHDGIRGRGSFRRVLQAAALLTSRRIPPALSLVIDRTSRQQLATAAELAETLGAVHLQYILPQPVPESMSMGTEVPISEWPKIRDEVWRLAARSGRRVHLELAYGYPFHGEETLCATKRLQRLYVDSEGRLCTCCQLSDYGANDEEVVADLARVPLARAWSRYVERMKELREATVRTGDPEDPLDAFPCLRCARGCGKLQWMRPGGRSASKRTDSVAGARLVQLRPAAAGSPAASR